MKLFTKNVFNFTASSKRIGCHNEINLHGDEADETGEEGVKMTTIKSMHTS